MPERGRRVRQVHRRLARLTRAHELCARHGGRPDLLAHNPWSRGHVGCAPLGGASSTARGRATPSLTPTNTSLQVSLRCFRNTSADQDAKSLLSSGAEKLSEIAQSEHGISPRGPADDPCCRPVPIGIRGSRRSEWKGTVNDFRSRAGKRDHQIRQFSDRELVRIADIDGARQPFGIHQTPDALD